jgi:GNAT superfamily N-acetyltransferase
MEVRHIDPNDVSAFDAWFSVLRVTDKERWPELPGWQRAERMAWAVDQDGPEEHRCLSATDDNGLVLGIADLEMFRRENLHLARIDVRVLPEYRRQGVGSAVVAAAEQVARETGRSELGGMDETPIRDGYHDMSKDFAEHLGFEPAMRMARRALTLPLTPTRLESLRNNPKSTPSGYSTVTFGDPWPDEFMADRCELGRRMSTDVPMGDQKLDEELWDEGRVRQVEASLSAQDRARITTAARHDASGRLVAYSDLVVPRGAPESSWQLDTLVMREHRGHGLGFAVKTANLLALIDAFPMVRSISTWNAVENEHMININEELGFEVVSNSMYWLKKIDNSPS